MTTETRRRYPQEAWWYAALAGALTATATTFEAVNFAEFAGELRFSLAAVIVATAVAVGLYRIQPGVGVAIVWAVGVFQVVTATPVLTSQVAVGVLAYGVGRYGSRLELAAGALSVVAAVPLGILLVARGYGPGDQWYLPLSPLLENAVAIGGLGRLTWAVLPALSAPLVVPTLIGIALRMWDRSRRSVAAMEEAQAEQAAARDRERQARQLADLREGQARLARDVHDVVGHSLTVILAQAQSAQYLDRELHPDVGKALGAISDTARASLADVRSILASTHESSPAPPGEGEVSPDFERMIEDVRAAGTPLNVETQGQARPLPPDQAVTLYRVLQEMLTNVLKHGAQGSDVLLTFDWRDALVVRIVNEVATEQGEQSGDQSGDRRGLAGMKDRMVAVGGTLATERDGATFAVTATFPHGGQRPGQHMPEADGGVR